MILQKNKIHTILNLIPIYYLYTVKPRYLEVVMDQKKKIRHIETSRYRSSRYRGFTVFYT